MIKAQGWGLSVPYCYLLVSLEDIITLSSTCTEDLLFHFREIKKVNHLCNSANRMKRAEEGSKVMMRQDVCRWDRKAPQRALFCFIWFILKYIVEQLQGCVSLRYFLLLAPNNAI